MPCWTPVRDGHSMYKGRFQWKGPELLGSRAAREEIQSLPGSGFCVVLRLNNAPDLPTGCSKLLQAVIAFLFEGLCFLA